MSHFFSIVIPELALSKRHAFGNNASSGISYCNKKGIPAFAGMTKGAA